MTGKGNKKKFNKKLFLSLVTIAVAVVLIAFWCVLAYIQLNSSESGEWNESSGTKFIAHRGYSLKYFQNTVQAFAAAGEEDFFQGIETDVRTTKDGVFVCSHDDNPFVDKSVLISKSNYEEIKDLPLDLSKAESGVNTTEPYRIALFSDYLNICLGSRKIAFIEIKEELTKEESKRLSDISCQKLRYTQMVFCSFYKKPLDYIYEYKQYLGIQLFTAKSINAFLYTRMGYNICVNKKLLKNDSRIRRAHKADVWIGAYTVNDADEAKKLIEMGVDYITCDTVLPIF